MSNARKSVQVIQLHVADLDFPDGALTRELIGSPRDRDLFGNPAPYSRGAGQQFGLHLCPPVVGPELRLQYLDQPLGEKLQIAMRPIAASDGEPRIFVLAHRVGGLSLDATRARGDDHWGPEDLFVFCTGSTRWD